MTKFIFTPNERVLIADMLIKGELQQYDLRGLSQRERNYISFAKYNRTKGTDSKYQYVRKTREQLEKLCDIDKVKHKLKDIAVAVPKDAILRIMQQQIQDAQDYIGPDTLWESYARTVIALLK